MPKRGRDHTPEESDPSNQAHQILIQHLQSLGVHKDVQRICLVQRSGLEISGEIPKHSGICGSKISQGGTEPRRQRYLV